MSYTKTNWQTGDTITAEKLNHAEQGIYDNSNCILFTTATYNEETGYITLDKTWNEINSSKISFIDFGGILYQGFDLSKAYELVETISHENEQTSYFIIVNGKFVGEEVITFTCETADGYPQAYVPDDNQ